LHYRRLAMLANLSVEALERFLQPVL